MTKKELIELNEQAPENETQLPEGDLSTDDMSGEPVANGASQEAETDDTSGKTVYRTQREVDAVIGKRLRKEREKWERQHAVALLLEKAMGGQNSLHAIATLLARSNNLDEQDVLYAMENEGASSLSEITRIARQRGINREAQGLIEGDPSFNLDEAMRSQAFRALIESGEPLERAYSYLNMDSRIQDARQQAEQALIESIRTRRARPIPLSPGGIGSPAEALRISDAMMRHIDDKLKRGEKVYI